MKYAVVLLAVVGCCYARPEAEKVAPNEINLADIFAKAQKSIADVTADIRAQLNLPEQEKVIETFKTQSAEFANQLQTLAKSVTDQVKEKEPEFNKVWEDLKAKISKAAEQLNANVPQAKESAEQLQKKFQESVETVLKESSAVLENFKANSGQVKEELAAFTKKAVDLAVGASQTLNEQLKTVAPKKD